MWKTFYAFELNLQDSYSVIFAIWFFVTSNYFRVSAFTIFYTPRGNHHHPHTPRWKHRNCLCIIDIIETFPFQRSSNIQQSKKHQVRFIRYIPLENPFRVIGYLFTYTYLENIFLILHHKNIEIHSSGVKTTKSYWREGSITREIETSHCIQICVTKQAWAHKAVG